MARSIDCTELAGRDSLKTIVAVVLFKSQHIVPAVLGTDEIPPRSTETTAVLMFDSSFPIVKLDSWYVLFSVTHFG